MLQFKEQDYDATRSGFDQSEIDRLTADMDVTVSSFFQDEEEDEKPAKEKPTHTYKCPFCGETFTK